MKNDDVTRMEKLCYEAQLKVEEAGQILCPETGEVAGVIRNKIHKTVAAIEDVIHNCYMLRDPVEPFYDNSAEDPGYAGEEDKKED